MNQFPVRIFFSPSAEELSDVFSASRCFVITTPGCLRRGYVERVLGAHKDQIVGIFQTQRANPTYESCLAASREISRFSFDFLVAIGGGSAVDLAKIVSLILCLDLSPSELKEVLYKRTILPENLPSVPIVAIPTTSGSGSEVTCWATLWDFEGKRKFSLSHRSLYPKISILDAELTMSLSQEQSLISGLDGLSHAFESIWNRNSSEASDALALEAIQLAYQALSTPFEDYDLNLRKNLQKASLLAGMASSQTRTAICHSISYPFTLHWNLPHGLASSFTLPEVFSLLAERDDFHKTARILQALKMNTPEECYEALYQLLEQDTAKKIFEKHLSQTTTNLEGISLIHPERAENFIFPMNEILAQTLAKKSLKRLINI